MGGEIEDGGEIIEEEKDEEDKFKFKFIYHKNFLQKPHPQVAMLI